MIQPQGRSITALSQQPLRHRVREEERTSQGSVSPLSNGMASLISTRIRSSRRAFSHTTSRPYPVDPPVTSGEGHRTWCSIGAILSCALSYWLPILACRLPCDGREEKLGSLLAHVSLFCFRWRAAAAIHALLAALSGRVAHLRRAGKSPSLPAY